MFGVVEVVAVDAPGLVEDLRPLGARVDADLDGAERRCVALARARSSALLAVMNHAPRPCAYEHLLRVGRQQVAVDRRERTSRPCAWPGRSGGATRLAAVDGAGRRPARARRPGGWRDRRPGWAGRRCGSSRPSKSIENGSFFGSGFFAPAAAPLLAVAAFAAPWAGLSAGFSAGASVFFGFSSSLSFASGDGDALAQHGQVDVALARACPRSTARTSPAPGRRRSRPRK